MKLALYCDGKPKCELELLQYDFIRDRYTGWKPNVEYREKRLKDYLAVLKADCFRQLSRAKTWEIFLIAESKLNSDIELYAQGGVELLQTKFLELKNIQT